MKCKDCRYSDYIDDSYYGRVYECGFGKERKQVFALETCEHAKPKIGFWEAIWLMFLGPVFTKADIEAIDDEYIEG